MCSTRWTVHGNAFAFLLNNFSKLMDWSLDCTNDTEMAARLNGVKASHNANT